MADIPQYVLDKTLLPQLSGALEKASLDVQRFSRPQGTAQGIEQVWICCDKSGQLFSFSTLEVSDKNDFDLKVGVVYLEVGPPEKNAPKSKRKDISDAFKRFEHALLALGAQPMKRPRPARPGD